MESPTRIKVAAATTAIAVGGLAGAGFALRSENEPAVATSAAADKARPVVIHRKRVRVKRVPAKGTAASSSLAAAPPGASSAPAAPVPASSTSPTTVVAAPAQPAVSVPVPERVSSRTSPAGSGGGEQESSHESGDRGEHEGGD